MDFTMCYNGNDMGAVYTKEATSFRVFAPTASDVTLCLYKSGDQGTAYDTRKMSQDLEGTWFLNILGDLSGVYYCYQVTVDGKVNVTGDPYAKACGVNGVRSMVIDLEATNPDGFQEDFGPVVEKANDIVVCEVSILDTTADKSSGVKNRGKYLGMAEINTRNNEGVLTGLSHYKELGVTHLQIMPTYDFGSIDESMPEVEQYNWGYDPVNYNIPEGSFSSDPFHGEVRVKEFKKMIQTIHHEGLGVIMDVVYNHMYDALESNFEKIVPGYYFRMDGDKFSDASACGNEVASDHAMVRKFIVDSVCYWAKEYHIDGFRFDLMGVLDIDTMNAVSKALKEVNPSIVIYGEGWTGGDSTLPVEKRSLKVHVSRLENVGMFSDDIRDGVKGHVFYEKECGFVNGAQNKENDIKFCVVGAIKHPEVDYEAYKYTQTGAYAKSPQDVVNYVSCHDNLTLWDKLSITCPEASLDKKLAMNRLAATIVFTSQGIPFFLGGEEFARTKPIEGTFEVSENSYNLPYYTNTLKYERLSEFSKLNAFYKGLISLRKKFDEFKLATAEEVVNSIHFMDVEQKNVVAYTITTAHRSIFVAYNANEEAVELRLPDGKWGVYLDGEYASDSVVRKDSHQTTVKAISALVAVQEF